MSTLRKITLTGVNGDTIDLVNGEDYELGIDSTLHAGPSFTFSDKSLAQFSGGFKAESKTSERLIAVPIVIFTDSENDVDSKISRLVALLDPKHECQITHTREDGTGRTLYVQYRGGLDNLVVSDHRHRFIKARLVFQAAYPFWQAREDQPSQTFSLDGVNSTDGAEWSFNVDGDIDKTWPRWRIEGHCENVEIIDLASGQYLRMREILTNANVVRIDTDPRNSGVWLDDLYLYSVVLDDRSSFFHLRPGNNRLIVKSNAPAAPAGSIKVEWDNHYQTI